jgi:signal transduction histidine kinase
MCMRARAVASAWAMVERIIKDHNGEVRVHSEVGRGSTFTLELPLAKEQEYDR